MVGQASNFAYTGKNICAGSYNENESGEIENGYKHVWDFGTSQANGQISCACLTSHSGGIAGAGIDAISSDWSSSSDEFVDMQENIQYVGRTVIAVDRENNCVYTLASQFGCYQYSDEGTRNNTNDAAGREKVVTISKKLKINKVRFPFNEAGLFDGVGKVLEGFEIPIPQELIDSIEDYDDIFSGFGIKVACVPACFNCWGMHLFVYIHYAHITVDNRYSADDSRKLAPNDDFYIIDFDIEKRTSSLIKVKNTTGAYLSNSRYCYWEYFPEKCNTTTNSAQGGPIFVTDKYIIMKMDDGYLYRLSRKDNTNVKRFTCGGKDILFSGQDNNQIKFLQLGKNASQWNKNKFLGHRNFGDKCLMMFDFEKCTAEYLSMKEKSFFKGSYYYDYEQPIAGTDLQLKQDYYNSGGSLSLCMPPFFLVTINNLDTPVEKTAADIMKVTYTLTQVDA